MRAYYDLKPAKLYRLKQGVCRYVYDIEKHTVDNGDCMPQMTQWSGEEVEVAEPLTSNRITQAVIADRWDADYEQKLINEYNAAKLGLYDDDTAAAKIDAYEAFLRERAALKAQIDADCEELGIA